MKYQYTKAVSDSGFIRFIPRIEFIKYFNEEYELVYVTEESYYEVESFFKKIDQYFSQDNIIKKTYKNYVNKNKDIVINELIYIDKLRSILYAFKTNIDDSFYEYHVPSPLNDFEVMDENKEVDIFRHGITIEIYGFNNNKEYIEEFLKEFTSKEFNAPKTEREINLIVKNEYGLQLKGFPTKSNNVNIYTHYNDDFKEISDIIISKLNEKDSSGIVLFSGVKGSGKTNYLRYLTEQIKTKKVIYIPPNFSSVLADPEFLTFMFSHTNTILIIEDAENVLKSRKAGENQAVSNLLNLSDGLLGDGLKIQVICTFNCDILEVDDALLRPGRLIAEYKFDKLNPEKSQSLLKEVHNIDNKNEAMTLAEIYNYKEKVILTSKLTNSSIGFNKNK